MNRRPAPLPAARAGVALATAALRRADRERYRAEFLAELHALPPAAQLRYVAGVLVQTLALRAALGSIPTRAEEAAMTVGAGPISFRCRLLHRHRWVRRSTEDGGRYTTCTRCGRDRTAIECAITPDGFAGLPRGF